MVGYEIEEADITIAIKQSRRDKNRTYARYRAVGKVAQDKLLEWLKDNGYIDNSIAHLKLG